MESINLIKMAQERQWKSLGIVGVPYHLSRCMLQIVGCLNDAGIYLDVTAICAHSGVDWDEPVTKKLLGGGSENGIRSEHVRSEVYRSLLYAMPDNVGTRNATYAEGNEYFRKRNALRRKGQAG